jgi:hypothetical protein
MQLLWLRKIARTILPDRFVDWYRRKRATRQYLEALSYELLERETRLDHLEGRIAARRDGFYHRIVTDVLERTELILQELDRRIEGLSARTGQRLASVEDQMARLSQEMRQLREVLESSAAGNGGPAPGPAGVSVAQPEQAASAVRE